MIKFPHIKYKLPMLILALMTGVAHAADPAKGGELYAIHCASCHGVSGVSIIPNAPNFAQNEGLMSPDGTLLISIRNGKAAMPSYQGVLSDQDILNVIAYLRTLN